MKKIVALVAVLFSVVVPVQSQAADAKSLVIIDSYFQSNVVGSFNVAKLSAENNVKRVVYAASSSCYGIPKSFPTSEDAGCDPKYPYALTKYLGEQIMMHWNSVYDLPVVCLRLFNVYGPRARTSGTYGAVFGVFLAQKLAGAPFTIVGDGTQTRSFQYVDDLVEGMVRTMNSKDKFLGPVNLGNPNEFSMLELAETILK